MGPSSCGVFSGLGLRTHFGLRVGGCEERNSVA